MSDDPYAVHSIAEDADGDPLAGRVVWSPAVSLWQGAMLAGTLAAPFAFSWSGLAVFLVLTGGTLLVGHSVGFHRRLIHGSFRSPLWLDHLMVYVGTLVGMSARSASSWRTTCAIGASGRRTATPTWPTAPGPGGTTGGACTAGWRSSVHPAQ